MALNHVSGTKAGIFAVYQRAEHRDAVNAIEAWGQLATNLGFLAQFPKFHFVLMD